MKIQQYKEQLAAFNTADFGEYTADIFISGNQYRKPTVYPKKSHPRILFTESTLDTVRKNLTAEENAYAYERYIYLSDADCDGCFKPVTGDMKDNWEPSLAGKIEAKAFRYAMTGDKKYGYEAIIAAKNAMLTINVPHTVGDWCRTYGYLMYVVACTYDWCYDLLSDEDKRQLIAGCVNLLGMHLEIVCYTGPENKVPNNQGTAYGHGAEDQLLVDYFSFAIACYNEAPEIYELVGGRILNDYAEAQNFLFQGGSYWEGTMYGAGRAFSTHMANIMVNRMTDGEVTPFSAKLEDAAIISNYYVRPDGRYFHIGDLNENRVNNDNCFGIAYADFLSGNFYGNSYLKDFAYKKLRKFSCFYNGTFALSPIQLLALNNPEVSCVYEGEVPLTRTASWPHTSLFAKSAHNDKNAFALYMTMPENYVSSHAHMECGSFQLYYKGGLVTDSGAYTSWGGEHHMGYSMQSVAANTLLIYNPSLVNYRHKNRPNMVYSGGQSIKNGANLPTTFEKILAHPALGQCTSLGVANFEENGIYRYSYMGGDMTKAYDEETVDEVIRYMAAVATDNKEYPFVFVTFDKITSKEASYHKSALIHVQKEPAITGDYAIIKNGGGRLVVQTVGEAAEYTVIGGEGREFFIPGVDEDGNYSLEAGRNLPANVKLIEGSIAEYGWGRIEISPAEAAKTNNIMTVMYVTDAENDKVPVKAAEINSEKLTGTQIFGRAVLFPKNEKLLTEEASFTVSGVSECFIAGVSAGRWTVTSENTPIASVCVEEGKNIIHFKLEKEGTYKLLR